MWVLKYKKITNSTLKCPKGSCPGHKRRYHSLAQFLFQLLLLHVRVSSNPVVWLMSFFFFFFFLCVWRLRWVVLVCKCGQFWRVRTKKSRLFDLCVDLGLLHLGIPHKLFWDSSHHTGLLTDKIEKLMLLWHCFGSHTALILPHYLVFWSQVWSYSTKHPVLEGVTLYL